MSRWRELARRTLAPGRPLRTVHDPLLDADALAELARQGRSLAATERFGPHPVQQRRAGDLASVHRGAGLEFDDSRPYQPGDDLRYMNWRLSARAREPYMKVFREEHRPGAFLVVDRRTTMRFGTRARLKAAQAARLAALTGFAAVERGLALGAVMLEAEPRWLPLQDGGRAALAVARAAAEPCPPQGPTEEPGLVRILHLLQPQLPGGSELTLISDFTDLAPTGRGLLLALAHRHPVRALQVLDAAELTLPAAGHLRLEDPVSASCTSLDTGDPATREAFAQSAAEHWRQRLALLDGAGIPWRRVLTGDDAFTRLLEPWP